MSYSTDADLLKRISEATLIALTDDEGVGAVDDTKVTAAKSDADATIDSYCQGRYPLPLSPIPPKITQVSADLTVYNLYSLSDLEMPEVRKDRNKEAIRFLEKVAAGGISLGTDTPTESTDSQAQATRTKDDRIFSIGKTSDGSSGSLDNY